MRLRQVFHWVLIPGFFLITPRIVSAAERNDPSNLPYTDLSPYQMEEGKLADPLASPDSVKRDLRLDAKPTSPDIRGPKRSPQAYGCCRTFLYRGRLNAVDSFNRQDGERLRPVLKEVPEAIESLDLYQENRRNVRVGAYVGTTGVVIAVASLLVANQYSGTTQRQIRTFGLASGLGLAIGFGTYTLAILRTNESNLQKAADKYNKARPDDPIMLQFSTGILF